MKREEQILRLKENTLWDIAVIGGGATGLGICLDAALRGLKVVLLEAHDFAHGTSSRSTKLVHGGVRYLAKGDIKLVLDALYERGLLMKNAPHLVKNQQFIIPVYSWFDAFLYTVGLKVYDLLAGKLSLGKSKFIGAARTQELLPGIKVNRLKGGVVYHDGQFDDSRLAVNLAQSCCENGACVINYMPVRELVKSEDGKISGVEATDLETGTKHLLKCKVVINATGVFANDIIRMDQPTIKPLIKPSQGIHLVVEGSFLDSGIALMIPKTDDGRVLFAIPWHRKVILGTTDTLMENIETEPKALGQEIDFILTTAGRYFEKPPKRQDVLSVFAGLRPLAAPADESKPTREISRDHKIIISPSGLITIVGGKWTTYRRMAGDVLRRINSIPMTRCRTRNFRIHGYQTGGSGWVYGSDSVEIDKLIAQDPSLDMLLHPDFPYKHAHVVWAVREEMARTVEDVLTRRLRLLFLDARASMETAPTVAGIIARELNYSDSWKEEQVKQFTLLALDYQCY